MLGPLLFLLYINGINAKVKRLDHRLYADDTLLPSDATTGYITGYKVMSHICMSGHFGGVCYSTTCLHMQIDRKSPDIRIKLGDDVIQTSNIIKFLGVCIQSKLKWNPHITKLTAKANRSLGVLHKNLAEAPLKTKLIAYKTHIQPI